MNILKFLKPKACVDFVYDDNTARQALEKMKNHGFTAVPVIDREGRYVKTLAEGDFLWFMLNNGIQDMRELEKYRISEITRRVRMKPVYVYSTIEDLILLSTQIVLLCTELKANPKVMLINTAKSIPIHGCFNPFFI